MINLQKFFLVVLISLATVSTTWAKVEGIIGSLPVDKNPNLAISLPESENSEILISRDQFLLSYNKNRRAPNWVAWKLEQSQLGNSGRTNKFQLDTELENYLSQKGGSFHAVESTDYKNSCFDRGHQIPSGDRTDTKENNEATFVMSNMIPQTPYLNRVIWEHLEAYTRDLVQKEGKKVYVIAGPIYDIDYGTIGPKRDIPVPSKDFKIVIILNADQKASDINSNTPMISVIMPNVLKDGQAPVAMTPNCGGSSTSASTSNATIGENTEDWKQYQTTLADIENKAKITFSDLVKATSN